MIIDWIILGVAIVALLAAIVVFVRRFPHAAALDLKSIPKHVQKEMKEVLIQERLERKFTDAVKSVFQKTEGTRKKVGGTLHKWHEKLKKLEERYKDTTGTPRTAEQKEQNRQKITTLLEEGKDLFKEENYAEAERKFIEIISLDHKNIDAYDQLSEVYMAQKNWENAQETLAFVIKMNPEDDHAHLELAIVMQELDKMKEALDLVKRAVQLNPKNPKNITALIEIALTFGEKFTAKNALQKLKDVNPENQKIKEWEQKIAEL